MALVVETGAGLAMADSFASVAEADAFWSGRPTQGAAWLALPTGRKEECLRDATDYVGMKLSSRQPLGALPWPWVDTLAPIETHRPLVVRATVMAADVSRLGPLVGSAAQGGRVTSESKGLGPLTKSTTYADRALPASANGRDLEFIDNLLRPLLGGGGLIIGTVARA